MTRRSGALLAALAAFASAIVPLALAAALGPGCGGGDSQATSGGSSGSSGGGGEDAGKATGTVTSHPGAAPLPGETECKVVITTGIVIPDAHHVPLCTPVAYATNPPSGGPHWPVWAAFSKYTTPVPRELYTHDLEHGAVVLSYRCKDACPDVVAMLSKAFDDAADVFCIGHGSAVPRLVLTPDPELPTPVAASAWGATYTATCLDPKSLASFIAQRQGLGPEELCANGSDPALLVSTCLDAGNDAGDGGDGGGALDGGDGGVDGG